ncbi:MAG: hypothetical protein ABIC04_03390 [Nanoarchaeota archaeon]
MKKAQVTIFIILGIIILATGVVYFAMRTDIAAQETEEQSILSEQIPIEFDPVQMYVENCLTEIAMKGLKILGERGGYINPAAMGYELNRYGTEGNAITWAANWVMPYWWHLKSANTCDGDCVFDTPVPEGKLFLYKTSGSPSIQAQLEEYVNSNIKECLFNFMRLRDEGYKIRELDTPQTTVRIIDDEVLFGLRYPIEATKISTKTISQFSTKIDVDLKGIYEFASLVTSYEIQGHFLENYITDMIVAFSGADAELPPMSETLFRLGGGKIWSKNRIEQHIHQNILPNYIQALRVFGTQNYEAFNVADDPISSGFYNNNMVLPGNRSFTHLTADFFYDGLRWKPYFDLNCNGDECRPTSILGEVMQLIGLQRYNFLYDLSFPTMVTIRDPRAFLFNEEEGYTFNFLLEANIRNNKPLKADYTSPPVMEDAGNSMVCDSNKRLSGNITIHIKDSLTQKNVPDAQVLYTIAGESCYIGSTDMDGNLAAKFPIGFNGIISFMKQDYITYSGIATTQMDKEQELDVSLTPIITKPFTVGKVIFDKHGADDYRVRYSTMLNPVNLSEGERAMITLTRKPNRNEAEFSTYAELWGNRSFGSIRIAPGEYEMRIDLFYHKELTIPERTLNYDGQAVIFPGFAFNDSDPMPNGGLHCDEDTSTGQAFLESNPNFNATNIILFKTVSLDLQNWNPSSILPEEDLVETSNYDKYKQYCFQLAPHIYKNG